MTLFASILASLGLSQAEAADFLGVRLDTVKSWSAGRNRTPDGVLSQLHALAARQEDAAQAVVDAWEEAGKPAEMEMAIPDAAEIARRGWPSEGAFIAVARRIWEMIGTGARIKLVQAGSTKAVRAAERARKFVER